MISKQKLRGVVGGSLVGTRSRILACLVLALGLLAMPLGAWATTAYWIGPSADYNTLGNWVGYPLVNNPGTGAGETAYFSGSGPGAVGISAATDNAVGFGFYNTAGKTYTITVANAVSQGLTAVTVANAGTVTIAGAGSGAVTLADGGHIFSISTQPNSTTLSLPISGPGSIDKTGDGALVLSGNNSYSGGTTLNAGSLGVGHANALGTESGCIIPVSSKQGGVIWTG